jgi:hypothetical protein
MPSGGSNKFTIEKARLVCEQQGFKLVAKEYKGNNVKMAVICSCQTPAEMRLSDIQNGHKCRKCRARKSSERNKTSDADISTFCQEKGCQFVRSWIQSKRTRIEYVCKCGKPYEAYWTNFQKCPNCKKCGSQKITGANCYMYDPDREAVAMRRKFRRVCDQHIRRFMKASGQKKTKHTHELLGYTPQQLQEHILNHPEMARCGEDWHIDHIWPIQAFVDHGIFDLKLVNQLSNLRPMPGKANLSKADKYDEKEFVRWLNQRHWSNKLSSL